MRSFVWRLRNNSLRTAFGSRTLEKMKLRRQLAPFIGPNLIVIGPALPERAARARKGRSGLADLWSAGLIPLDAAFYLHHRHFVRHRLDCLDLLPDWQVPGLPCRWSASSALSRC